MSKAAEKNIQELLKLPVQIVDIDADNDIVEAEIESNVVERVNVEEKHLQDDFELARQNIRDLTVLGKEALKGIMDLAKQDDHARPWEVAGQMLKNLSEINKDLLDIHEKKKNSKAIPVRGEVEETKNVTNAVFVGSTTELLDMIKKKNG